MGDFALQVSSKLISRKIRMIQNSWNFHTVLPFLNLPRKPNISWCVFCLLDLERPRIEAAEAFWALELLWLLVWSHPLKASNLRTRTILLAPYKNCHLGLARHDLERRWNLMWYNAGACPKNQISVDILGQIREVDPNLKKKGINANWNLRSLSSTVLSFAGGFWWEKRPSRTWRPRPLCK